MMAKSFRLTAAVKRKRPHYRIDGGNSPPWPNTEQGRPSHLASSTFCAGATCLSAPASQDAIAETGKNFTKLNEM